MLQSPRPLSHPFLRPSFAARALLAVLAAGAAIGAAHAQVVVLRPPPVVHEVMPPPRPGFVWRGGYWGWRHGRYLWMPGGWVVMQPMPMAVVPVPRPLPPPPPAPPPAQVSQVLRLSADALFAFDRGRISDMLPGGRAQIRDAAARLNGRYARIEVRGYTDRLGSSAHNLRLSRQRAESVKALLVQDGIPADRIQATGLAAADPISACQNGLSHAALIACLQPDRRVEIVIYSDQATQAAPQYPGNGYPPNAYPPYPGSQPAPYAGTPYPYPPQSPPAQYPPPSPYPRYPDYPGQGNP